MSANWLAARERMPTGEKYSIGPRSVGPIRHTKWRPASSALAFVSAVTAQMRKPSLSGVTVRPASAAPWR